MTTSTAELERLEEAEEDIREAVNWHFGLGYDEIDDLMLYEAAEAMLTAWDGDGWYEIMAGGHAWGYDDARYYDDRADLGACVFSAMLSTSTWYSRDYLNQIWASKVTDPDDIAELEAMWD